MQIQLWYFGGNPKKDSINTSYYNGQFLNGNISLVRIYNRTLSENEIKQNYNYDNKRININDTYFENIEVTDSRYTIASLDELKTFRDEVNNGNNFEGVYVELKADINLGENWIPIGNEANTFNGIFNGNGHNITSLNTDSTLSYQGLFGNNAGTIENINIKTGTVKGINEVGAVAGHNTGAIINCTNEAVVDATGYRVGGICGYNLGSIQKCSNTGDCSTGLTSLAGIAGRSDRLVKFCHNDGKIIGELYGIGGIVGTSSGGIISSCYNTKDVTTTGTSENGNSLIGGILGQDNVGEKVTIKFCYNSGNITGAGSNVGGIIGAKTSTSYIEITYCYNTGNIVCKTPNNNENAYAGGIIGTMNSSESKIQYCYNTGNVTCETGTKYPGGIAGYNASGTTVSNCYTLSTKISTIIGNNKGTSTDNDAKADTEMQAEEMITLLGGTYSWYQDGGYPKLMWE